MAHILDTIVDCKKREVDAAIKTWGEHPFFINPNNIKRISFSRSLQSNASGIIAEFKRRSPSKGEIHPMANVSQIVPGYESCGATACSILTDTRFFGGAVSDFLVARKLVNLPLLRKEFIIHEFQIEEAAAIGADAILLIASILSDSQIKHFTNLAHSLNMEVLFEIHNIGELDKFIEEIDMVGVNNRDLRTFHTNSSLCEEVVGLLPPGVVKVAESGLSSLKEVKRLRDAGYSGFLIGESFMKHSDPARALRSFLEE